MLACCGIGTAVSVQRAAAQNDATGPTPGKIAVFNRKTVFDNYKKREVEWKALEDQKTSLQAEIDKLREDVNAGRKKLREDKTLTEQQKQELTDKVTADERNYEDRWRRAQGEIDDKSGKFFSSILGQIDAGVREFGAAKNFKIILDSDPKAGTPVLYFAGSIDITEDVIKYLNGK
jgi:Skp family chaperone for outer membrane proteins